MKPTHVRALAWTLGAGIALGAARSALESGVAWLLVPAALLAAPIAVEALAAVRRARDARRAELVRRYGADEAARILAGEVWQGMSEPQLREALGAPAEVTRRQLKTRSRAVYKYRPEGRRFALRVTLDDGAVTAWDGEP
jgi:hypothetical protein